VQLSTVAPETADAAKLAKLSRQPWSIKRALLHLAASLRYEVRTLSYPPTAPFAVMAFDVPATLKAALLTAHGAKVEQNMSRHTMVSDLRNMGQSLQAVITAQDWEADRLASSAAIAALLLDQAPRVWLGRYVNAPAREKPPTPAIKRVHDPRKPHVALSLARCGESGPILKSLASRLEQNLAMPVSSTHPE
jgi:hypothetical protein